MAQLAQVEILLLCMAGFVLQDGDVDVLADSVDVTLSVILITLTAIVLLVLLLHAFVIARRVYWEAQRAELKSKANAGVVDNKQQQQQQQQQLELAGTARLATADESQN